MNYSLLRFFCLLGVTVIFYFIFEVKAFADRPSPGNTMQVIPADSGSGSNVEGNGFSSPYTVEGGNSFSSPYTVDSGGSAELDSDQQNKNSNSCQIHSAADFMDRTGMGSGVSAQTVVKVCVDNNRECLCGGSSSCAYDNQLLKNIDVGCKGVAADLCATAVGKTMTGCEVVEISEVPGDKRNCTGFETAEGCENIPPPDNAVVTNPDGSNPDMVRGGGGGTGDGTGTPGGGGSGSDPNAPPNEVPGQAGNQPGMNPGGTATGGGSDGSQELAACMDAYTQANECCNNPLSCMGISQGAQQTAGSLLPLVGVASSFMGGGKGDNSIKQACDMMKMAGYASGGINAGGAFLCNKRKNTCVETCEGSRESLRQQIQAQCGFDPQTGGGNGNCPAYQAWHNLGSRAASCTTFSNNVAAMGKQAVEGGTAAQMANLCANLSNTQAADTGFEDTDFTAIDCSDPSNKSDPRCGQPNLGDGTSKKAEMGSVGTTSADFGSRPQGFNTAGVSDGNDSQQGPQFPEATQPQANSTGGVPQNGGGFNTGSGGGGGFGGGGNGGGGRGGGYNTDVLGGLSGGNGYTGNPGGGAVSGGGGFSGYGNNKPTRAGNNNGFDLKAFLPGGKKDPRRGVAGMNRGVASTLGARHEDIWTRITNRFQEKCKFNLLYCNKSGAVGATGRVKPARKRGIK